MDNRTLPYPRVCAHRGLSALYPENTLPSFAAAIEAGAQEIELDLRPAIAGRWPAIAGRWPAGGGRIVVRHDPFILGVPRGLPTFEDVLAQFARRVIMNIHVKAPEIVPDVVEAIARSGCREYVYIAGNAAVMEAALALAPDIERCCLEGAKDNTIVKHAIRYKAQKLQGRPCITREMIAEAHAHGIRCNLFYTDDPEEARGFFRMGIDTVLTNNCVRVLPVLNGL